MLTETEYRLENLPQPLGDADFADPDSGYTIISLQ